MLIKECYFYSEVQDMGAHIPTCTKQDYLGVCPCDNCKSFIPMSKANKIIKSYLDLDKREEKEGCAAMAELKPCPFCGGTNITILSKKTNIWRNGFGDTVEYRVYSARCNRCNARGATAGGQCAAAERTINIYGTETLVHSYKYYHDKAAEAWNRRSDDNCTDDDTAEWIDKEVRGTMTNVCSACGSCSVYPDKYCGGCGRSMKNGY